MLRLILTALLISALSLPQGIVLAQQADDAAEEKSAVEEAVVTLDFREADIRNVLKVLSYKSGVNIIAGPEVTGIVNIQLKEVPWEQALDVILATYGYGYERKGNILTVTTIDRLKQRREDAQLLAEQEPLTTKTFLLSFGKAEEIIDSLEKMKTDRGSINFDQRMNAIIVRDIASNMGLIEEVIANLDAVTPQVLIEAQIIETTVTDTEKLGIDWTVRANGTLASRPHQWPFRTSTTNQFTPTNFPAAESTDFTFGTLNANTMAATLEYLNTQSDTNILSKPTIMTLDNQEAEIVVGIQYPIPSYTYNEDQAKLQVSGFEYKDIGIIFKVTPHVNNANLITLDLEPQVTAIEGESVTVENTTLPQLSAKSAKTRVMVRSGDTVVIAGLMKDQETDTDKRVPFLGSLPILGNAFKKKEVVNTKTELMIFLTPRVVTPSRTVL